MPLLVSVVGLLFALYVGRLAGTSDTRTLGILFGGLFVTLLCLWLRSSIWLLIPLCWGLTGKISLLPLPFSVRDLSVMLVAGMFGIFFALKMVRFKSQSGFLEVIVAINIAYIVSMFIRHPVGTSAFGSDLVGGRPYFDVIIGLIAFLLFRLVTISPKQARIFPFFLLAGTIFVTTMNLIVRFVPALTIVIAPIYSGINVGGYMEAEGYSEASTKEGKRVGELAGPGSQIIQILCSYYKPITLLLPTHPLRMLLLVIGGVGILYSGFRGSIISMGFFFLFASYFHGGSKDLVRCLAAGVVLLLVMVGLQLAGLLPLQGQRALSFIPFVPWNELAKANAEDSSQWRVEMWKLVLNDKKYINDKIWGDGFGFSAYELSIMRNADFGGTGFIGGAIQESFMIAGAFHSGPISSMRYAGLVGFTFFMVWLIHLSFQALQIIKEARGTPFFPTTLFFFMPMIYGPLLFIVIFGDYQTAIPDSLFASGMLRMIKNSLHAHLNENLNLKNNSSSLVEQTKLVPLRG